ncbi:MAG: hypothetical protein PHE84_12525 [bacterium]|nr:hypothetical protein [bacterium]
MKIKAFTKLFQSFSASILLIFFLAQPCLADNFSIAQDAFSVQPTQPTQETKELKPKSYVFPILWDLANPIIIGGISSVCLTKPKPETEGAIDGIGCIGITLMINAIPYSFWTLPSDYYVKASKTKKIATPIIKLFANGLIFSIAALRGLGCGLSEFSTEEECNAIDRENIQIWFGTIAGISVIEAVYHGFKVHEYNENLEKEKQKRLILIPIPTANGVGMGLSMSF